MRLYSFYGSSDNLALNFFFFFSLWTVVSGQILDVFYVLYRVSVFDYYDLFVQGKAGDFSKSNLISI